MPSVYYEINKKSTFCISRMTTTILDVIILTYIFIYYNILFIKKQKVLSVKGFKDYEYACDIFISSRYLL